MNKHQQIAYENPCFEAEDTLHPRFFWQAEVNQARVSIGLTANCGLE